VEVDVWLMDRSMKWRPIGLWDVEDPALSRPGLANLIHLEGQI
jgi:hypothetical protein